MNALKEMHDQITEEVRDKIKEFGVLWIWVAWAIFAVLTFDVGGITLARVFPPLQYVMWFAIVYSAVLIVRANKLNKENASPSVGSTEGEKKEE